MFILIVALAILPCLVTSTEVFCEKIEMVDSWTRNHGIPVTKTCQMGEASGATTAINSTGFAISSEPDESAEGFNSWNNSKIEYLPEDICDVFPNLIVLSAGSCSIKSVSKDNFRNLNRLRYVHLYRNEIERIDNDVFDDNLELQEILLCKICWRTNVKEAHKIFADNNKIKSLSGKAFWHLAKLTKVLLANNLCIDEDFQTIRKINEMPVTISEECGSYNVKIQCLESTLNKSFQNLNKSCTRLLIRSLIDNLFVPLIFCC